MDESVKKIIETVDIHGTPVNHGTIWLHTHGMEAYGKPELEIRDVPAFLVNEATSFLNQVCAYVAIEATKPVLLGQSMKLGREIPFTFTQLEGDDIGHAPNHYEEERWALVGNTANCLCGACEEEMGKHAD
jgi:hypothetical protein